MRARTLMLLVVALILAGGTTMMARVWLASQRSAPAEASPLAVPTPARSVLIARSTIQRGQLLKPDDLAWEPWPEAGIDKNYVVIGTKTPDAFTGWVARQPISAGDPITDAKIIAPGHPERSVMLHRIGQRDKGHMPPLATRVVDEVAVEMLREWILQLAKEDKK